MKPACIDQHKHRSYIYYSYAGINSLLIQCAPQSATVTYAGIYIYMVMG